MEKQKRKITGANVWDMLNPFVITIVMLVLVSALFTLVASHTTDNPVYTQALREFTASPLIVNIIFYGICLFLMGVGFRRDNARFGKDKLKTGIGKTVLAIVIAVAACHVFNILLSISPLPKLFPGYTTAAEASFMGQGALLLIASNVLLGPAAEELIFRGLTMRRMRHYLGSTPAVIISSALFALYHGNVMQMIYAFVIGIVFSKLYEKTGSIYVNIIVHMALNALVIPAFL